MSAVMLESDNPFKEYTAAHQALRQHLADTIGADVERALDGVNWQHTTMPPVAPQVTPPAEGGAAAVPQAGQAANPQTPATPQSAPAPATPGLPGVDWEQFRDPTTKLILGKYQTGVDAARGMHSLLHMAKDALGQRDRAVLEADQLRQRLISPQPVAAAPSPVPAPVVAPKRPEKLDAVFTRIKENNSTLDAEDLQQIVDSTLEFASQAARQAVEEDRKVRSLDQQKWSEVDAYMRTNHPNSMAQVDEMQVFAATKPEVGRIYNRILNSGDDNARLDATLYLWSQYSLSAAPAAAPVDPAKAAQEQALNVQAQVRKEEVDAARVQAGLTGTAASGAHEAPAPAMADAEAIDRAAAMMKQLGEQGQGGALWRSLTIAKGLDHPIFNP